MARTFPDVPSPERSSSPDAPVSASGRDLILGFLDRRLERLDVPARERSRLASLGLTFAQWCQPVLSGEPGRRDVWCHPERFDLIDEFIKAELGDEDVSTVSQVRSRLNSLVDPVPGPRLADDGDGPLSVGMTERSATSAGHPRTPEIDEFIDSFVSEELSTSRWLAVADSVRAWVRSARPANTPTARLQLRMAGSFAAWHVDRGGTLDPGSMFSSANVDEFFTVAGYPDASRNTYRSALRTVGRAATGLQPADRMPAGAGGSSLHLPDLMPYSSGEVETLLRIAESAPQARSRRALVSLVLLGAGAGVVGASAARVTHKQVSRSGDGLLTVTVMGAAGAFERVVPVRTQYAEQLESVAGEADGSVSPFLLGGSTSKRERRPSHLYGTFAKLGADFEPRRLRLHWLVEVLSGPVPLADALAAAGLSGPEPLRDVLPFLRPSNDGHRRVADPQGWFL